MDKNKKNVELTEKIKSLITEYNITFNTIQQPYQKGGRRIDLHSKSTTDIIIIDHANLIND